MTTTFKNYTVFEEERQKCRACSIGLVHDNVISSVGCKEAPLVAVIGECPAKEDIEENTLLSSKQGILLKQTLNAHGFRKENTIITNVVPCRPPRGQFPEDDNITQGCVEQWLSQELLILKPTYILLVGGKALELLTGLTGITKNRGSWIPYASPLDPSFRANIIATFHPSYVLGRQNESDGISIRKSFEEDIRQLSKAAGFNS
jgi:uracil-DNA glycosylase family 4